MNNYNREKKAREFQTRMRHFLTTTIGPQQQNVMVILRLQIQIGDILKCFTHT